MAATVPALTRGEARLSAVSGCRFLCICQLPSRVRSPVPRLRTVPRAVKRAVGGVTQVGPGESVTMVWEDLIEWEIIFSALLAQLEQPNILQVLLATSSQF